MSLTEQLKELADASASRHPGVAQDIMAEGIAKLKGTDILANATKKGATFPNFNLPNATNNNVELSTLLKKGKVVLAFYRGGWCPYCNLELKALQEVLPQIKEKGATLVAITPETPDNTLSTVEKNELGFEVLSSKNNQLARDLGLVYTLPSKLVSLYGKFGIDLEQSQGNDANELPIAATYIIDQNNEITYSFLAEDYKLRADPSEILKVL